RRDGGDGPDGRRDLERREIGRASGRERVEDLADERRFCEGDGDIGRSGGWDGGERRVISRDLYPGSGGCGAFDDQSGDGIDHGQWFESPDDHGSVAGGETQPPHVWRRDGGDGPDGRRDLERR